MMGSLLVDMGNTQIKWVLHRLSLENTYGNAQNLHDLSLQWELLSPESILVSSVLDQARNDTLAGLCERLWAISPRFVRTVGGSHGVELAYKRPEKLGVDRWLVMLAARHLYQEPCLIVDAGTALTLDALDGQGRHLGGLIVPGLNLMRQTLFSKTQIPVEDPVECSAWLGRDTAECISAGATQSAAGLIERTRQRLSKQLNQAPKVIMTGGDARQLCEHLSCPTELRTHLVLEGLAVLRE